jgi:hypothetical protein
MRASGAASVSNSITIVRECSRRSDCLRSVTSWTMASRALKAPYCIGVDSVTTSITAPLFVR